MENKEIKELVTVGCRLTKDEYEKLLDMMNKSEITNRSEYLRKCIFGKEIIQIEGIKELVIEIKKLGSVLNEITNNNEDLKEMKENYNKVIDEILKIMKKVNELWRL